MEKVLNYLKNFIKNKSVGYWIIAADALISLILAIVFFATYKSAMHNAAWGYGPETIGVFLLAGFFIELAVLVVPQYRALQVAALFMFCLSLYKEVLIIPNLIADWANNVYYQGGNLSTNVFYIVTQFIIIISGIVALFLGFYKDDKEATQEMKINFTDKPQLIKVGVSGIVVVAAVLAGCISSGSIEKKASVGDAVVSDTKKEEKKETTPKADPITQEIKDAAAAYEYDFDPTTVIVKQNDSRYVNAQGKYDFSNAALSALSATATSRQNANLVYYFESTYSEGYQGDYGETYGKMYLWDDGLFNATIGSTNFKGYWYNSSIENGKDEGGNDIIDCCNMESNQSKYESIITEESTGFYTRSAYCYLYMSWGGTRSTIMNGYYYYPEVALFIDTAKSTLKYKVGDKFDRGSWSAMRVLKNLTYSAVFKKSEVSWDVSDLHLDSNSKFTQAGEFEVTATWNGFTAKVTVTVE